MSGDRVTATPLCDSRATKAELLAMLAALDARLRVWDDGVNPILLSAVGQIRRDLRQARAGVSR